MKIVKLTAENIKKLVAVEITPTGEIVTIAGKNGQGKTSVLDSIWWALAGTSHIQKQPIRRGQSKARVRLDLGELVVERRFSETGSSLFVESAEGARYPSPQKMLDALIGELSFDPLAFARMDPRKQFDELRRVAKLEVDIEQLDGLNRADYGKRTDLNREAKAKRAQAAAIVAPGKLPDTPVDESALLDQMEQAGRTNAEVEKIKAFRRSLESEIPTLERRENELLEEAESLLQRVELLKSDARRLHSTVEEKLRELAEASTPDFVDVTPIRAELERAKLTNSLIAEQERRKSIEREAEELETRAKQLTEQMDARETVKREAIMGASLPVEGLGFGDGVVTFNDVPFEQSSSAEQLRVSLAIAMAANPKLRVIRIQDGSLLDDESLAQIGEMAKANEYQVWIERVDDTGKVGIIIEDGMVRGAPLAVSE